MSYNGITLYGRAYGQASPCLFRLGLLHSKIHKYLLILLDFWMVDGFRGITREPLVWFWCKIDMHAYLMGILFGFVPQQNPPIFNEAVGLWLVDGFHVLNREPLVRFWCNSLCTIILWVSCLGLLHSNNHAHLMRLLDFDWLMVSVQ
jgi:hypothetical protein